MNRTHVNPTEMHRGRLYQWYIGRIRVVGTFDRYAVVGDRPVAIFVIRVGEYARPDEQIIGLSALTRTQVFDITGHSPMTLRWRRDEYGSVAVSA